MFIALTPCADLGEGVWGLDTPSPEKVKFLKLTYKITEKIHRFPSSQQSQISLGTPPPGKNSRSAHEPQCGEINLGKLKTLQIINKSCLWSFAVLNTMTDVRLKFACITTNI